MDKPEMAPIQYGDLFTIEEFTQACQSGAFIDYDGHGIWATDKEIPAVRGYVSPSDIVNGIIVPEWATHVLWFNR